MGQTLNFQLYYPINFAPIMIIIHLIFLKSTNNKKYNYFFSSLWLCLKITSRVTIYFQFIFREICSTLRSNQFALLFYCWSSSCLAFVRSGLGKNILHQLIFKVFCGLKTGRKIYGLRGRVLLDFSVYFNILFDFKNLGRHRPSQILFNVLLIRKSGVQFGNLILFFLVVNIYLLLLKSWI